MGEVDVVEDDRFRVATESERVWLSLDAVFSTTNGYATLVCGARGVADFTPPAFNRGVQAGG